MNENMSIPHWLPSSATALESFFKTHPDAEQQVREILDKPLEKVDANTSNEAFARLDTYWGKESTDILLDVAQQPDQARRLEEISKFVPPEVLSFLRKIIALYGPKLADLAQVSKSIDTTALESFLKSHPDAERQVREILDKRLNKADANTWNTLISSLDNYWGKESTNILIDVAQQLDSVSRANRLDEISKSAPPEVTNFLRTIFSLYEPELANASLASNQLSNGWQTFYRDVYADHISKRSHIRIRLAKYNGEEPIIEGNADSILELTVLIIRTLGSLPVPDLFGKSMVDQFTEEANKLIQFFQHPIPGVSDDNQLTSQSDPQANSQK